MNWHLKYLRLFFEWHGQVMSLAKAIAEEIAKVSTTDWWVAALMRDNKSYDRLIKLFSLNDLSIEDSIVSIQNNYQSAKYGNEELKRQLEVEEATIQKIIPKGTGLDRFLNGKGKSKYTYEDLKLFRYFDLWFALKHFTILINSQFSFESQNSASDILRNCMIQLRKYVDVSNSKSYNSLLEMYASFENEELPNTELKTYSYSSSSPQQFLPLVENFISHVGNAKQDDAYADVMRYLRPLYEFIRNTRQEEANYYMNQLFLFFSYLNADLLGVDNMRIIKMLRNHPFAASIQTLYDYYCVDHTGLTKRFVFADVIHRLLSSDDFKWDAPKSSFCFNIPWNRYKIQILYDFLRKSYIDRETDVRDFCYALTGCKPASTWEIRKVNWSHKDKQSLALFIGELVSRDTNGVKWSRIPKVFLHNGEEVYFHSSTQCGQARKSGKYDDLINAILEAEKLTVDINEIVFDTK